MRFLLKAAFWFCLVLIVLPFLNRESSEKLEHGSQMEIGDTFSAANEAFQYIGAMCIHKPDICEKGAETFVALGHRAREGARIAYEFLNTQFSETDAGAPDDEVRTGTIATEASDNPATGTAHPPKPVPVPEKRLKPTATSTAQ